MFIKSAGLIQETAFLSLLVFTPLARGATSRWAFCISLWLALTATTAMILKRLWRNQRLLPRTLLEAPLALLLFLALISLFISIYRTATEWALLRLILYMSVFYLTLDSMASTRQTRRLILTIICMGSLIAMLGFIKYGGGPLPFFGDHSRTGVQGPITSTFINHNHLAGYLEMVFALGLGLFLLDRPFQHSLLLAFSLILILAAILLSMSRGGWIALAMASGLMLTAFAFRKGLRSPKTAVVVAALILVAGFSFLGSNAMIERLQSLQNPDEPNLTAIRLPVWEECLRLIREHPLQGTGLGTFPWSFTSARPSGLGWRFREAHNDYLQVLTELGLPVMIPVLWGLYLVFKMGFHKLRRNAGPFHSGVVLGALGGIVAILIHSGVDFNIQITSNGVLFSVLIGIVAHSTSDGDEV